jgi:hypothetical protein
MREIGPYDRYPVVAGVAGRLASVTAVAVDPATVDDGEGRLPVSPGTRVVTDTVLDGRGPVSGVAGDLLLPHALSATTATAEQASRIRWRFIADQCPASPPFSHLVDPGRCRRVRCFCPKCRSRCDHPV